MKKTNTRLTRLILWLLLFGLPAGGFLRHTTADASCGVIVTPDQSIQTAINDAPNGQIICVRGGVYQERLTIVKTKTGLTLRAYEGETPIIDGNKRLPSDWISNQSVALVEIAGDGTTFDGFEVRFSSARGIDVTGNNVTVRNSAVHDNWTTGINVIGGTASISGVLIENNHVYDNLRKVEKAPAIYRGTRSGSGPTGWTFDPETVWDDPFWSGAAADLPESSLYSISMTFNDDGHTTRVYAGSARASATRTGNIGAAYSANGQTIAYSGNDILFHDPTNNKWTLYFDGGAPLSPPQPESRLPAGAVIDAFLIESVPQGYTLPAPILMSFAVTTTVGIVSDEVITPTLTAIGPSDLVRFTPTDGSNFGEITAGYFTLYKLATDLSLPSAANIDALDLSPTGALLISLTADTTLSGNPIDKEDLAAYDEAAGSWSLFFEGDKIPYNPYSVDLTAAWLDAAGNIYISGDPIGGSALAFINTTDSVARGNHVYYNYGEGIVAGRFSQRITLEDNVAYDNFHANLYLNSTTNPLVQRNLIYCTNNQSFWRKGSTESYRPAPGLQIRDEDFSNITPPQQLPVSSGQVIINNLVVGCSNNFGVSSQRAGGGLNGGLVANNTFVNARGMTPTTINNVELSNDVNTSYTGSRFINNLIIQRPELGTILRVQGGVGGIANLTKANNLYSINPGSSGFGSEPGAVIGDPQLIAPNLPLPTVGNPVAPADYRLTYTSPAFDNGQALAEVADDFFGLSRAATGLPDIGADELAYEGTIRVVQATTPAGAAQRFDYTADFTTGSFNLGDGESHEPGLLPVGVYNVAAAPVEGWVTAGVCDDGSPAQAIDLSPGETVICTFNSVRAPQIVVVNQLTPVDGPSFDFSLTPGEAFQLGHDSRAFNVAAGIPHAVTAIVPDGWRRATATCDNGDPLDAVVAAGGEVVTCTFNHEAMGRIVVSEQATPANTGQSFVFSASYDGDGFALQHGQNNTSAYLPAGTYAVAAATPAGWVAGGGTCDDGSSPNAIDLSPGETVACTFAHEQMGRVIVRKVTTPPNTGQLFTFTASYDPDGFTLLDGQSNTSEQIPPGGYSVSEVLPPGWAQSSATCDDGSPPATIVLDPGETVTCTFSNGRTAPGPLATIYVTTPKAGSVRGLAYAPGDILAYDGRLDTWSLYFDASDVGIIKPLSDFVLLDDGSLLLAVNARVKLNPVGSSQFTLDVQDVARFAPTSLGTTTAGSFSLYFDGSDVALSTSGEKIDALALRADGGLLISVTGTAAVKNGGTTIKAADEDLLLFQPTSLGATTTGAWSLAFDGSTIPGLAVEDVTSAWQDADEVLYLTVMNNFSVGGVPGTNRTVLAITPARAVSAYWNAAPAGYPALIDGLHIVK